MEHPCKLKNPGFKSGYSAITTDAGTNWDPQNPNSQMDFGVLILNANEDYETDVQKERALILLRGKMTWMWGKTAKATTTTETAEVTRQSLFDENPWVLSVPQGAPCKIKALSESCEVIIVKAVNSTDFEAYLFPPAETQSEDRGAGTMRETSTRIVKTVFDYNNRPQSKLVIGEVVNYPGKWSSYPPHHHPQPEIYHYRFLPEQGFGFAMLGNEAAQVKHGDTTLIIHDNVHSQTSAPGYAMWYLWAIYHLNDDPYGKVTFLPEHTWVTEPDADIWPPEA